jgi:hypothetical protein
LASVAPFKYFRSLIIFEVLLQMRAPAEDINSVESLIPTFLLVVCGQYTFSLFQVVSLLAVTGIGLGSQVSPPGHERVSQAKNNLTS